MLSKESVTYSKAIGILLMVLGHCSCSIPYVTQVLYMFHMPLFFFLSGYCLKEKYMYAPKQFVLRRIKGLYWPYVKWSLLFLCFHNLFFSLNIYNATYGKVMGSDHLYDYQDFIDRAIWIPTHMTGHDQLLGAYWFMRALFLGSLFAFILLLIKEKIVRRYHVKESYLDISSLVVTISISVLINHFSFIVPYFHCGSQPSLAASFILIGFFFKKYDIDKFGWKLSLLSFFVVVIGSFFWRSDMNSLYYENGKMVPFIITGVLGTWVVYSLPWETIGKRLSSFFNYIGTHTLQILTWHFLSFKIISLSIILLYDLPIEHLAEFPVIESFSNQFWLLYFVTGVIVPLALTGFFNLLCARLGILKTRA